LTVRHFIFYIQIDQSSYVKSSILHIVTNNTISLQSGFSYTRHLLDGQQNEDRPVLCTIVLTIVLHLFI